MKRTLTTLLTFLMGILLICSLAACGNVQDDTSYQAELTLTNSLVKYDITSVVLSTDSGSSENLVLRTDESGQMLDSLAPGESISTTLEKTDAVSTMDATVKFLDAAGTEHTVELANADINACKDGGIINLSVSGDAAQDAEGVSIEQELQTIEISVSCHGAVYHWINQTLVQVDGFVWGLWMCILLIGTGIFLTVRCKFLHWRNLGYAIKNTLSKEARTTKRGSGDVSPFAALTTALAATIGTGNIVGVATALVSGGPGALLWMEICACFGLSTKFSECMLAIKYREVNVKGEMSGGPMYTMKKGFKHKKVGTVLGWLFALFAVIASFGIGNLTQANSISSSLNTTWTVPAWITGAVLTVLTLVIIVGGIKSISKVSSVVVPVMAIFYIIGGIIVIIGNYKNIPGGIANIVSMAFGFKAVAGGLAGTITASMMQAVQKGFARGCFSNEAGMGSAAITAASATTDHPVRQAYINMTGTFWDTIVVCTITGLAIASSGVLGTVDPSTGANYTGAALTIAAFQTVLGKVGGWIVTIGIALFAFSTILGWEYHGEKAFEYLFHGPKFNMIYRVVFSLIVFVGATTTLDIAWNFSDIANALMAIPNLICLLVMSKEIARDMQDFQSILLKEKNEAKAAKIAAKAAK